MPPEDTGAGTGSLVGYDLRGARHSVDGDLRRDVSRAHRASIRGRILRPISPTISSASPRSCRASPAGCATAPRPASTPPPRRRWCGRSPRRRGASPARRARNEDRRARARRRRRARARPHRGGRGARRDGREAGRHCRHLDRRDHRRGLCRRHDRPRDAALRHPHRAQPHRRDAADDARPRRQAARPSSAAGWATRRGSTPSCCASSSCRRNLPEDFSGLAHSAHRDRLRPLPPPRGGVLARAAAARACGLDLAADHHAAGGARRAGSGRWRRDQSAAVRAPARPRRRDRRGRDFRAARTPTSARCRTRWNASMRPCW